MHRLEDACTDIKVTKKSVSPNEIATTHHFMENKAPNMLCEFPKLLAVIDIDESDSQVVEVLIAICSHYLHTPQMLWF